MTITVEPTYQSKLKAAQANRSKALKVKASAEGEATKAREGLESLVSSYLEGGSLAPSDYASAKASVELAEIRLSHADASAKRASMLGVPESLDLAEAVASAIVGADGFDCDAIISHRKPDTVPNVKAGPVLVIVQSADHRILGGGGLGGTIQAYLYSRSKLTNAPDDRELQAIADRAGFLTSHYRSDAVEVEPGVWETPITFTVSRGYLPVPDVTPECPDPGDSKALVDRGPSAMLDAVRASLAYRYRTGGRLFDPVGKVEALGSSRDGDVISDRFGVLVSAVASPNGTDLKANLAASMRELKGILIPFVGVVHSVVVSEHAPDGSSLRAEMVVSGNSFVPPGRQRATLFATVTTKRKAVEEA